MTSSTHGDESKMTSSSNTEQSNSEEDTRPKRNTNLNEISGAVVADDDDTFQKSSFGLKRTQSLGVLNGSSSGYSAMDLIGSKSDYPHLSISDGTSDRDQQPTSTSNNNAYQLNSSGSSGFATTQHEENIDTSFVDDVSGYVESANSPSTTTTGIDYDDSDSSSRSSLQMPGSPDLVAMNDDSAVQHEPQRHVDYLSHNWKESDISASWRYIVLRRKDVANAARLENASWRTWTKAKYNLSTVSPESVNWLKDYDVTWLYGPLYQEPSHSYSLESSGDNNQKNRHTAASVGTPLSPTLSDSDGQGATLSPTSSNSSGLVTKPILKKKSASQKILDTSSLASGGNNNEVDFYFRQHNYRHRAPVIPNVHSRVNQQYVQQQPSSQQHHHHQQQQQQQTQDLKGESASLSPQESSTLVDNDEEQSRGRSADRTDARTEAANETASSAALSTPSVEEPKPAARHIHFNDRVEQYRVISYPDTDDEDGEYDDEGVYSDSDEDEEEDDDEDEDEDGLFLMVRSTSHASLPAMRNQQSITIEPMPATTLKYDLSDHEQEERQTEASNSVAYAMSHNTANRRHVYKTYDYSSVFESPEPSPDHSPRSNNSYESFTRPSKSVVSEPVAPQTSNETAIGQFSDHHHHHGDGLDVESTAGKSVSAEATSSSVLSPPILSPPDSSELVSGEAHTSSVGPKKQPEVSQSQLQHHEQTISPASSNSSEDRRLGRINSAVSVAKDFASSFWHGHWKKN